jgi:LysM repeat protein
MHVRFVSPKARRAAVKVYDRLVATGLVSPPVTAVSHRVVAGDTLSELAQHYGCSVAHIRKLNSLKSDLIKIGQRLTLQKAEDIRGARDRVYVPPRRLPPAVSTPKHPPASAQLPKPTASDQQREHVAYHQR